MKLLGLVAIVVTAGCSSSDYLAIESRGNGWGPDLDGGSSVVVQRGTYTFPERLELQLAVHTYIDGEEEPVAMRSADVTIAAGSPCVQLAAPRPCGEACATSLQLMGPGTCLLHARGVTASGDEHQTCWYYAVAEVDDLADQAAVNSAQAQIDLDIADCE